MTVLYKLQIVKVDDKAPADVVQLPAGGTLETELIADATAGAVRYQMRALDEPSLAQRLEDAIAAQGVGFFRTEAHVRQAIRTGLAQVVDQDRGDVRAAIAVGLAEAFTKLKAKTRALVKQRK